jgi:hypothetical protein
LEGVEWKEYNPRARIGSTISAISWALNSRADHKSCKKQKVSTHALFLKEERDFVPPKE